MPDFNLQHNQAALILESSEDGEVNVEIAIPDNGAGDRELASILCTAIAKKLISDEQFQTEIMAGLDEAV